MISEEELITLYKKTVDILASYNEFMGQYADDDDFDEHRSLIPPTKRLINIYQELICLLENRTLDD